MKIVLVVFVILSLALFSQVNDFANAIAYFPPPLKQIQEGVEPTNVTCTEGLELVLKLSNGQPACIKPSSVEKLIQRGWAIHILPDYENNNNNSMLNDSPSTKENNNTSTFQSTIIPVILQQN